MSARWLKCWALHRDGTRVLLFQIRKGRGNFGSGTWQHWLSEHMSEEPEFAYELEWSV